MMDKLLRELTSSLSYLRSLTFPLLEPKAFEASRSDLLWLSLCKRGRRLLRKFQSLFFLVN